MSGSERRTLRGRRIVITRARSQAGELASALEALGAEVLEVPTIEFADPEDWGPLDRAIGDLDGFTWVIFTSTNGVERFVARLDSLGLNARALLGKKTAAIGPATAEALQRLGVTPDVIPSEYRAEALAESLPLATMRGCRVLIPRALKAREVLPRLLREAGADVVVAPCYRTVVPSIDAGGLERTLLSGGIDLITFTSSSTVSNFASLFPAGRAGGLLRAIPVACIGPITASTARELGIEPAAVAAEYTIPGLVATIERLLAPRR